MGKLEGPGGVVQKLLRVVRLKNAAGPAVPDALETGNREAPAVEQISAEQRGGGQVFIGFLGENAGGRQLQSGEAGLLHGGIDRLIVRLIPGDVGNGKLDSGHGQSLQALIKAQISRSSSASVQR